MDDFYVTLSSNASADIYPGNKTSNFSVNLCREINVENFKVALSELIFPLNFNNVAQNNNTIKIGYKLNHINEDAAPTSRLDLIDCMVPTGYYKNITELIDKINSLVIDRVPWKSVKVNIISLNSEGKVEISGDFKRKLKQHANIALIETRASSVEPIIQFENRLATMLGYEHNVNLINTVPKVYDLTAGFVGEMFIYLNVVDNSLVSNSSAPLLRVYPISSDMPNVGRKVHVEFLNRNYTPVSSIKMRTISVECRNAQGNFIPFIDGSNMILTLHFTRQKI